MSITEFLDQMDAGEAVDLLAIDCMAFTYSADCGHVDAEMETLRNHPCGTCGVNVETRTVLFHSEERIVVTIFDCYRSTNSKEMCVLLFCTLIEHHLRNLIKARCRRLNLEWVITDLLLDKYSRAEERMKLFERLTGITIQEAVNSMQGKHVFDSYFTLRNKRHGLAHGLPAAHYAVKKEDVQKAVIEAVNSFPVFANLYHRFCAVNSPALPKE